MLVGFAFNSPWHILQTVINFKSTSWSVNKYDNQVDLNLVDFKQLSKINTKDEKTLLFVFGDYYDLVRLCPIKIIDCAADGKTEIVITKDLIEQLIQDNTLLASCGITRNKKRDITMESLNSTRDGCLNSVLNFLYSYKNLTVRERFHTAIYGWFTTNETTDQLRERLVTCLKHQAPSDGYNLFVDQLSRNELEFVTFQSAVNHYFNISRDYEELVNKFKLPLSDLRYITISIEKQTDKAAGKTKK